MAKEQNNNLTRSDVTRGISNEEYGFLGSVYNTEGVNIRESAKYYCLDSLSTSVCQISNSSSDRITAMYINNATYAHFVSYSGNIYTPSYNYTNNGGALYDSSYFYINTTILRSGNNLYGVVMGTAALYRRVYNGTKADLGLLGTTVVTNGTFITDSDWTKGTDWSIPGGRAIHTAGTGSDLSQVLTVLNTTEYRVQFRCLFSAGTSLVVKMGGATLGTVTASGTYSFWRTTASTSETLAFTASADLGIFLYDVSVQATKIEAGTLTGDNMEISTYHPFINLYPYLYVAGNNTVTQIDISASATRTSVNSLILAKDEIIIGMTNIGTRIYVYTNKYSVDTGVYTFYGRSRQYLRDGVSKERDEMIERPRKNILAVKNNGTFDYVVTGKDNYRELYKVSGWDKVKLYQSPYINSYATDKMGFISNTSQRGQTVDINRDILYMVSNSGLYSFGSELPGLSESLSKNYLSTIGDITATQVGLDGLALYSSGLIATKPRVYKHSLQNINNTTSPSYTTTGFVEYNPIVRDKLSTIKKLEKMQIGYQLQGSVTNIQIYIKIDDGSYTLLKTITGTGTTTAYGRSNVMTQDFITAAAGMKFYKVQFKVVLNSSSSTKTPKVFDLSIKTDTVNDVF